MQNISRDLDRGTGEGPGPEPLGPRVLKTLCRLPAPASKMRPMCTLRQYSVPYRLPASKLRPRMACGQEGGRARQAVRDQRAERKHVNETGERENRARRLLPPGPHLKRAGVEQERARAPPEAHEGQQLRVADGARLRKHKPVEALPVRGGRRGGVGRRCICVRRGRVNGRCCMMEGPS